ncbi:MAG: anaerobic ribonucleoside-triphosphate reductase activating protein [Candidatus Aenigmatarchaeota archaeon]
MTSKLKVGGILDMSTLDYPGKISSVIFLHGCNFRCPFCFNYELVVGKNYKEMTVEEILKKIAGFRDFIDAVVITGGEPTLQDIETLCKGLKKTGLLVKIDTNGTNPDIVKKIVAQRLVDFVAMDVKAPFNQYFKSAGVNLDENAVKKIKETFDFLIGSGIDYELRCPVVPGVNLELMGQLAQDVKDAKIFVLEQFWADKGTLGNIEGSVSREQLLEIAKLFKNRTVKIKTREKGEETIKNTAL